MQPACSLLVLALLFASSLVEEAVIFSIPLVYSAEEKSVKNVKSS
jgi:hypothetical protein